MNQINVNIDKKQDYEKIKKLTSDMFLEVLKMIELSQILLTTYDNDLALEIIEDDVIVDSLQKDIIVEVNNYILVHTPSALELRQLLGTYQLIGSLERIGDNLRTFAKDLIKKKIEKNENKDRIDQILLALMDRLSKTKEAYINTDHELAKDIAKGYKEYNKLTKKLIKEIKEKMSKSDNEEDFDSYVRLILLAKFFERSGDHVINICEEISYIKKGQLYHYS